jgi:hypothetical protein
MKPNTRNIEVIVGEIMELWKNKDIADCPFWDSLTSSYYDSDKDSIKKNKFYSEISFYPNLINYLAENATEENNIEITFFSTLLPRHYWNFPLLKKENFARGEKYFISQARPFLDKYRGKIVANVNKKIVLKRLLIVADKRFLFKNTQLFGVDDLKKDQDFYLKKNDTPPQKQWDSIINQTKRITAEENEKFGYSTGCPIDRYYAWFTGGECEFTKELKSDLKGSFYYEFDNKRSTEDTSVLQFYLNELHSKSEDGGNAKIIILTENKAADKISIFDKKINTVPVSILDLSSNFKPDLSIITIKGKSDEKTIILNTYMDLFNDIVKLEVVDIKDEKFVDLMKDINYIINLASPFYRKKSVNTNLSKHKTWSKT